MSAFAQVLSIIIKWVALISMTIMGLLIYKRYDNKKALIFLFGIIAVSIGQVIQEFAPTARLVFDQSGTPISISKTSGIWYMGSFLSSIGILISMAGFGLVAFTKKS